MDSDELNKKRDEIQTWLRTTAERMHREQKYQQESCRFGDESLVIIMDRNKDHGNYELTVYQVDSARLEDWLRTGPHGVYE